MYKNMAKALVFEVCEVLGCDPRFVKSVTITPTSLEVVVYKTNEDGAKYLHHGQPAVHNLSLPFKHVEPETITR